MYKRLLQQPLEGKQSFFLFGPRGVGKTSWLKTHLPTALSIDLLDAQIYFDLLSDPHRIVNMISRGCKEWIVIDEVQKVPALLNEVHRMIENEKYRFILTGSSARTLRKKGTNLLAGRALYYKMFPLTALELGNDFRIEESIKIGQLPTVHDQEIDAQKYLNSYIHVYLKEEIMQEGLTRNAGSFARFLQTASFSQGSVLNVAEIAREAEIERKTVEEYFQITEDLLLSYRIPVFTKQAKRKTIAHSKFYYFDLGVYRNLRPMGPFDSPEEAEGPALESLVFQELLAINHYFDFKYDIYFWKTVDKLEIDFILYGPSGLLAIEVKRSKKIDTEDLKALKAFQADYPIAKPFLFYGGSQTLHFDGIQAIPISEALLSLPKILGKPKEYH
jgi:predicted AAA+ superfamily ATPase